MVKKENLFDLLRIFTKNGLYYLDLKSAVNLFKISKLTRKEILKTFLLMKIESISQDSPLRKSLWLQLTNFYPLNHNRVDK